MGLISYKKVSSCSTIGFNKKVPHLVVVEWTVSHLVVVRIPKHSASSDVLQNPTVIPVTKNFHASFLITRRMPIGSSNDVSTFNLRSRGLGWFQIKLSFGVLLGSRMREVRMWLMLVLIANLKVLGRWIFDFWNIISYLCFEGISVYMIIQWSSVWASL